MAHQPYYIAANTRNSWMGDSARVIMCKAVIEVILEQDLVSQTVNPPIMYYYF
jgi:hypothetical protein